MTADGTATPSFEADDTGGKGAAPQAFDNDCHQPKLSSRMFYRPPSASPAPRLSRMICWTRRLQRWTRLAISSVGRRFL